MTLRTQNPARPTPVSPAANGHIRAPREVHYPEGDGKPMAETGLHALALMRLMMLMRFVFDRRSDVHVTGNLMMYWVEGDPRQRVSPDVLVAVGVNQEPPRRTWQTWVDGVPTVIFDISSRKTRCNDFGKSVTCISNSGSANTICSIRSVNTCSPNCRGTG